MPQVLPAHQEAYTEALEYLTRLRSGQTVDHRSFAERNLVHWQAASETLDMIASAAKSLGTGRTAQEQMVRLATIATLRRHLLKTQE